jgi:citrate synthase
MSDKAKLIIGDKTIELPVFTGTEGEKAVDITKLRAETGFVTLDSGYMNTGACTSSITFLDGEQGILKYRGYSIEEIAEKSSFIESSYLVFYGKLPSASELKDFESKIASYDDVPEGIKAMIKAFPKDAHPMCILSSNMPVPRHASIQKKARRWLPVSITIFQISPVQHRHMDFNCRIFASILTMPIRTRFPGS